MKNKSILKLVLLVILALFFWYSEVFYFTPMITDNKPTQIIISMATYSFILFITIYAVTKILK